MIDTTQVFGTNQYKLRKEPLGLYAPKESTPSRLVTDKSVYIRVPAFSVVYDEWPGSSYIVANATITASAPWSIITPVSYPEGFNACVVIRWIAGDGATTRYKLWRNVGEKLAYPLYAGEIIPASGVYLEFWCVDDGINLMTLPEDWYIKTAQLTIPTQFNDVSITLTGTLGSVCETNSPAPSTLDEFFTRCV